MIIQKDVPHTKQAVGCIMTYKSKYFLIRKVKDDLWNSITATAEEGTDLKEVIIKAIKDYLGIELEPEFFTTTLHKYGDEIVKYHIFDYEFKENPEEQVFLNLEKVKEVKLFDFEDAIHKKLYEDEDHCIRLHHDNKGYI